MISETVLVLGGAFGERLGAGRATAAIARGLEVDELLKCDPFPVDTDLGACTGGVSKLLDEGDFDRRMRAARAVVIVCARLDDRTLAGSVAFEAATRARQSGVPAYAVTGHDTLDPFEARIVDLQVIFEARTVRALTAAGRKLAALV